MRAPEFGSSDNGRERENLILRRQAMGFASKDEVFGIFALFEARIARASG
jgi:transposase